MVTMRLYIGVTDLEWFWFLADRQPDEVNFWRPGGSSAFRALPPGGPFLFKLHSPRNFIVGGGFFVGYTTLPVSIAWETFGTLNGLRTYDEFRTRILHYRRSEPATSDPVTPRDRAAASFSGANARLCSGVSHWNRSASSAASTQSAVERSFGVWNCAQSRSVMN